MKKFTYSQHSLKNIRNGATVKAALKGTEIVEGVEVVAQNINIDKVYVAEKIVVSVA